MQKVNREKLGVELSKDSDMDLDVLLEAAQAFYNITAPNYMCNTDMVSRAFDADCNIDAPTIIFRAMAGELIE